MGRPPITPYTAVTAPGPGFAVSLKRLRLARGLTQVQLGQKALVSASLISQIESQKQCPGLHVAWLLARALEASLDGMILGTAQ